MLSIGPATLPLTPLPFQRALGTGHGRALQHVLANGTGGLDDILIEACLRCPTYDPQVEPSRAPWLAHMLGRGELGERGLLAIQAAVEAGEPETEYRDREHRRDLLKELALKGVPGARALLYGSCGRDPEWADVLSATQIVELDGPAGLLHVAARIGRWLKQDASFCVDDELLEILDTRLGAGTAETILESAAASDPMITQYLAAVREWLKPSDSALESQVVHPWDADKIIKYVHSDAPGGGRWLTPWGRQATPEARARLFEALLQEQNPERAYRFLCVFTRAPAPAFDERLWQWLEAEDPYLSRAAVMALGYLSHSRVREAALSMLGRGDLRGVLLFRSNYRPGDYEAMARLLRPVPDDDQLNETIADLLEVVESNPESEARDCLLFAYEHSPSSYYRKTSLRLLLALQEAPPWVLEEARFDASPDVVSLCSP
jgi:hypothetical protein